LTKQIRIHFHKLVLRHCKVRLDSTVLHDVEMYQITCKLDAEGVRLLMGRGVTIDQTSECRRSSLAWWIHSRRFPPYSGVFKFLQGVVEARSIERERPSFYRCTDMLAIKGSIAKKLNQMNVVEIGEDEEGGDAEEDEAIAGFSDGSDSDEDMVARGVELLDVQVGVDDVSGEESLGGGQGDVVDKEAEQRLRAYKLLRCRRSMLIKSLRLISLKKMASLGRFLEVGGTMDSPFQVVRQEVLDQEGGRGGKEGEEELKMQVREAQAKLDRLEQRKFTMRNAVDRRHAEESMRELQQEIRCLQSDAFNSMFLVVKGKVGFVP